MPASLTVQVRLGFSMGWRIWTPNEVGFYAKTLAHSYFILVILKAKFLREHIWIVNYNLFMGSKKYHVFIEFLKFGMKSKEERCFWKKIIFVSLVIRHKKLTKRYFNYMDQRYRIISYRSRLFKCFQQRRNRVFGWKHLESKIFKRAGASFLKIHKKTSNSLTGVEKFRHSLPSVIPPNVKKKSLKYTALAVKYNAFIKPESVSVIRRLSSIQNLSTRSVSQFVENVTSFKKKSKSFFFRNLSKNKRNFLDYRKDNKEALGFKNIGFFSLKKYLYLKNAKNTAKLGSLSTKKSGVSFGNSTFFTNGAEKTLLEGFRFDPVRIQNKFSIFGGPRKRLSRNLRRAFKGKYVKHLSDLVWFWEKLSRLLSYYMHKYSLVRKKII